MPAPRQLDGQRAAPRKRAAGRLPDGDHGDRDLARARRLGRAHGRRPGLLLGADQEEPGRARALDSLRRFDLGAVASWLQK